MVGLTKTKAALIYELERFIFLNPGQKWVEESFVTNDEKQQHFKYI